MTYSFKIRAQLKDFRHRNQANSFFGWILGPLYMRRRVPKTLQTTIYLKIAFIYLWLCSSYSHAVFNFKYYLLKGLLYLSRRTIDYCCWLIIGRWLKYPAVARFNKRKKSSVFFFLFFFSLFSPKTNSTKKSLTLSTAELELNVNNVKLFYLPLEKCLIDSLLPVQSVLIKEHWIKISPSTCVLFQRKPRDFSGAQ